MVKKRKNLTSSMFLDELEGACLRSLGSTCFKICGTWWKMEIKSSWGLRNIRADLGEAFISRVYLEDNLLLNLEIEYMWHRLWNKCR